jgi:hypothetical protein
VSELLREPDDYELEIVFAAGVRRPAVVIGVDVSRTNVGTPFELGASPVKGQRLYSMGNPLDLDLTLAEDTNNGGLARTNKERML